MRGLVKVDRDSMWTLPDDPPRLIGAAVSVEAARWIGDWAYDLIAVNGSRKHLHGGARAFGTDEELNSA
jgi:hypothetical protein